MKQYDIKLSKQERKDAIDDGIEEAS